MSKKQAVFLTCGVIYYDKWPSVRDRYQSAARRLRAQGYTLKSDFFMHNDIFIDDPYEKSMAPLMEAMDLDGELYDTHPATYFTCLLRSFHAAVVICDLDKYEQEEICSAIRTGCERAHIVPEVIGYHSDDWTT